MPGSPRMSEGRFDLSIVLGNADSLVIFNQILTGNLYSVLFLLTQNNK